MPPEEAIPDVIDPRGFDDVLEVVTRAVFQAGVSWAQIAKHWDSYRAAFDAFAVARVAAYAEADVARVLDAPGILRSGRKVNGTIQNARALLDIAREFGTFHDYASSFSDYAALAKDMKHRFSFLGEMNVWYVLFRLGEPVPRFESWVATIPGDHPRMREMVERARARGRSPEYVS